LHTYYVYKLLNDENKEMFYNFFKAALNGELRAHPLKKTSTMMAARIATPDSINTSTDNLSLP